MDNSEETTSFDLVTGDSQEYLHYPKLFTLNQFKERYGEDNCTIMLQDRELELYIDKARTLACEVTGDPDWGENVQAALDAWKPCDDRPPTEIEAMIQRLLGMPEQAQVQFYRLIKAELSKKAAEQARVDADKAAEQDQAIKKKLFQPPADVGPPVTRPQQEPEPPASFESIGRERDQERDQAAENARAVEAVKAAHAADIEANAEDFAAPTAFEQGGDEDIIVEEPAQTEVGMPPPPTG